jgi:2-dehydro-3-deoxyphosphogluconate aldolase/(4S)-4-hydroxy-2-oxoglutarate aldolase
MARFKRLQVLNRIMDLGLVPLFFNDDVEKGRQVLKAVAAGGCTVLEFTNRGDHAWEVFNELEKFCRAELPDMILGAGSIVEPATAGLYINSGAAFIVSPSTNPEVARICNRRKIAYSPGCGSVTEIGEAEELGCEIVKLFPGREVGGPAFVKAMMAPCPWSCIMPTGGVDVTEESLGAWFKAGAACVGMGSKLVSGDILQREDWPGLTQRVRETLALIKRIRSGV